MVLLSKVIKIEYVKLEEPVKYAIQEFLLQRLDQLPNDAQLERGLASLVNKLLEVVQFDSWVSLQQFIERTLEENPRRCLVVLR